MRRSQERILTSHAGSLPRPDELIEANRARESGGATDERGFQAQLRAGVADVVRRQRDAGIDVPGDGEFGKSMGQRVNYRAWWSYSFQRLGGLELGGDRALRHAGAAVAAGRGRAHELRRPARPAAVRRRLRRPESGMSTGPRPALWPVCVGPLTYTGQAAIQADIANLKAALAGRGRRGGLHDLHRARQRLPDRQPALQDRRGVPVRVRRRHARGVQGDRRRRAHPAARRSGDRRELGHGQPRAHGRRLPEVLHGPSGGAQPRDPRPARGPHPVPSLLGELARPAHDRHPHARDRRG